ncbi:MAG: thiamine phosphate synthase [Eubacterium sp.]|nr:thiamine phosphate synthase [Eubacterium sp.]
MNSKLKESLLLYAVTDRHWLAEGEPLLHQVKQAVEGGATFVQLREKTLDETSFEAEGREILAYCREKKIPFVINDNVELAVRIGADGVHVGQEDMEAGRVRALIGPDRILGVSAQTVEDALRAETAGADYLGVGAVFPTGSKDDAVEVPHETLAAICRAVSIPVVAIGGITYENVPQLADTGIVGISVISAIFGQKDIREATKRLRTRVDEILRPAASE